MSAPVVGILGSGQLGRMLSLAAAPLGVRTHIFAPTPGPATQVTDRATIAAYNDHDALAAFADAVDVVTFEFENVPADTAAFLAERTAVRPGAAVLEICQHRIREKTFLSDVADVPTARWAEVLEPEDAVDFQRRVRRPIVLKTAVGGYDGKGQIKVGVEDDAAAAVVELRKGDASLPIIAEAFVDFAFEASVIVARSLTGEIVAWEPGRNAHRDHILHTTKIPAGLEPEAESGAINLARHIADKLGYVGVLGVELFVGDGGELYVNELAPRVHNSGHWTQDGSITSQFEQHIRAILGWSLGDTATLESGWLMTNLLGDDVYDLPRWLKHVGAHVHLYGKDEPRPGRKMGHVNTPRGT